MITMPIAGALADKIPVGRIVLFGLGLILVGMFGLTQVTSTTSYGRLIVLLVIMGFGMGAAMMPMFTNAVRTLTQPRWRAGRRFSTSLSRSPARSVWRCSR